MAQFAVHMNPVGEHLFKVINWVIKAHSEERCSSVFVNDFELDFFQWEKIYQKILNLTCKKQELSHLKQITLK